jgi:hypothetical protein
MQFKSSNLNIFNEHIIFTEQNGYLFIYLCIYLFISFPSHQAMWFWQSPSEDDSR